LKNKLSFFSILFGFFSCATLVTLLVNLMEHFEKHVCCRTRHTMIF